jgi:hypothetical protein
MCVPSAEHFLPVLIIAGASLEDDEYVSITEGPDGWGLSMRSFGFKRRIHPEL